MTVRLRLQRHGAKKRPFYRLVAADQRAPRDGRFIEMLGTYDPLQNPPMIRLDGARVDYWMGVGAQPSDTFRSLIRKWKRGESVIDLSQEGAEQAALAARATARKEAREAARKDAAEAARKAAEEAEKAAAEAKAAEEAEKKAAEEAKAAEAKAAEDAKAAEAAGEEAAAEGSEEAPASEGGDDAEKTEEG